MILYLLNHLYIYQHYKSSKIEEQEPEVQGNKSLTTVNIMEAEENDDLNDDLAFHLMSDEQL